MLVNPSLGHGVHSRHRSACDDGWLLPCWGRPDHYLPRIRPLRDNDGAGPREPREMPASYPLVAESCYNVQLALGPDSLTLEYRTLEPVFIFPLFLSQARQTEVPDWRDVVLSSINLSGNLRIKFLATECFGSQERGSAWFGRAQKSFLLFSRLFPRHSPPLPNQ
ncbi:hypothetical protein VTI74DRAFT_4001 [Chaetomium olivicolor]